MSFRSSYTQKKKEPYSTQSGLAKNALYIKNYEWLDRLYLV
jgi:hypothetical protein